jgi:hypothetical protein
MRVAFLLYACRFCVPLRVLLSFCRVLVYALAAAFCHRKCNFSFFCCVVLLSMLSAHVVHAVGALLSTCRFGTVPIVRKRRFCHD